MNQTTLIITHENASATATGLNPTIWTMIYDLNHSIPAPAIMSEQFKPLREMSYSDIELWLRHLPMTWYPALIKTMIESSIEKGCWLPGGATKFVNGIETACPVPTVNQ